MELGMGAWLLELARFVSAVAWSSAMMILVRWSAKKTVTPQVQAAQQGSSSRL